MSPLNITAVSILGGVLSASVVGATLGLPAALLVMAGTMLLLCIGFIWSSLESVENKGELTLEDALDYAAPTAFEEEKLAALRSLKDLEYELSVGKITPEDYKDLSASIREEAKRLIELADNELNERRQKAEARLQDYLNKDDAPAAETKAEEADAPSDKDEK